MDDVQVNPEHRPALDACLQQLNRDINCLVDDNRATRKRALERVRAETVAKKPALHPVVLQAVFQVVLKNLLRCVPDAAEKNRELAIGLLSELCSAVAPTPAMMAYIMPVLATRMGAKEITETAEELRKMLLELAVVTLTRCPEAALIYTDEYATILQRCFADPFPDVKRGACAAVPVLARAAPQQFRMVSLPLARALIPCLAHQHAKVRADAVDALCAAILAGDPAMLEDAVVPLAQRAADHAPAVRRALYTGAAMLLCDMPDRYSYWHRFLPLLLSGEADDVEEIATLATSLYDKVGAQYEKENEQDLKEQLDFGTSSAGRPRLGTRVLVQRNLGKLVIPLLKDLADWSVACRRQSVRLLRVLVKYAEESITLHLEKVLAGLCHSEQDDETDIAQTATQCVEAIGAIVPAAAWTPVFLPLFNSPALSTLTRAGYLLALGALLRGAGTGRMLDQLDAVSSTLADPDVSTSVEPRVRDAAIAAIVAFIGTAGPACVAHSRRLFSTLLSIMAANPAAKVSPTLALLATACGTTVPELYATHTAALLKQLSTTCTEWTRQAHERMLFETILAHAGVALAPALPAILAIFRATLDPARDAEMRGSFFTLLARLLADPATPLNATGALADHVAQIVALIGPNLAWQGGRTAGALRTAALAALLNLLQSEAVRDAETPSMVDQLLPQLLTCLDDDFEPARLVACHACRQLLVRAPAAFGGSYAAFDRLHKLYPELLKRLDDSSDPVRAAAADTWEPLLLCLREHYDTQLYQAHLDGMVKGLLVHLDDPDPAIHAKVLAALKSIAVLVPSVVRAAAETARHKHRNTVIVDDLLQAATAASS